MISKSYKLYRGGILLTLISHNKIYDINLPEGSNIIVDYYEQGGPRHLHGQLLEICKVDGIGNDKIEFKIKDFDTPLTFIISLISIITIDIVEISESMEDKASVIPAESETVITHLKDLSLDGMDELYESSNAEDAFREIGAKVKELSEREVPTGGDGTTVVDQINDDDPISVDTTFSAAKITEVVDNATKNKVDTVEGKGLSSNDYDDEDAAKVDKIVTTGTGTKVLHDDGIYKEISTSTGTGEPTIINQIDDNDPISTDTTFSAAKITEVVDNATKNKVDAADGMGLSSNDYVDEDVAKVAKIVTSGTGTKVLHDDGIYKELINFIDDLNLSSTTTTLSAAQIISQIGAKVAELVGASPDLMNTLDEISNALADDPNFATTITNMIASKVSSIEGMGLSSNDYTNEDAAKVDKIITTGDGTTFLSSDGTYKSLAGGGDTTTYTNTEITTMINTIWG